MLREVECFDSFSNSNGDHIRAELFKELLPFSEYDKAFLTFGDMNENLRDEIFGRELRSLTSMGRNSDKDFNKVGQYQCLDLVSGIL